MKTVYLIGAGMGDAGTLTMEAMQAIERSDLLLGAARLLCPHAALPCEKKPLVLTAEIVEEVKTTSAQTISVLLSGDPGFYSGAKNLYAALPECRVVTLPGISSVNYFCARLKQSWQDVALFSVHGRSCNIIGEVQTHERCLFLTGGKQRAEDVCKTLVQAGYGALRVHVGESLSYPEERILSGTAEELSRERFRDLAVILIENPQPIPPVPQIPVLWDREFQRGKVPMTKESVRLAVLAELQLQESATVWDVGAGTGSVSVGCALAARKGSVFAVEQKAEAVALLEENRTHFGVTNLKIIHGTAPEALEDLPVPEAVFIGGSSAQMEGIFAVILRKNPTARIVLTAVSLESLMDGLHCMKQYQLEQVQVRQLTAAQSRELGRYHMMNGENPVWILSGNGRGSDCT